MSARVRKSAPTAAFVIGGVIAGGLLIGGAVPAFAAYPPNTPVCSNTTSVSKPGAPVTITGVGFPPGATVTVGGTGVATVISPTVVVDSTGTLKVVEKLGSTPGTGQYTLAGTATSVKCRVSETAVKALTVTRVPVTKVSPTQVKGSLAFTGAEGIGIMSVVGLALVGAGTGAVVATRRRKQHTAA